MRQKFSSMVIPTPTPRRKYLPPSTCAGVRYLDEYDLEFKYTDFENLAYERGDESRSPIGAYVFHIIIIIIIIIIVIMIIMIIMIIIIIIILNNDGIK